ncbi:MAG: hypothetical protein GX037_00295 [Trueperella sp.]|nr:hypothetical protein [Trueperella sp.]
MNTESELQKTGSRWIHKLRMVGILAAATMVLTGCAHETGLSINVEGGLGNQTMMTRGDSTSGMDAIIEGQLGWTSDNCLGLALDNSMVVTPAVFPYRTVFLPEWDGIQLRDGTIVMIGEQMSTGGGYVVPPGDIMRHVPINCHVDGEIPFMNQ